MSTQAEMTDVEHGAQVRDRLAAARAVNNQTASAWSELEYHAPADLARLLNRAEQAERERDEAQYLVKLLAQDWGTKCCDRPDDCACTMAQAIRLAALADQPEQVQS